MHDMCRLEATRNGRARATNDLHFYGRMAHNCANSHAQCADRASPAHTVNQATHRVPDGGKVNYGNALRGSRIGGVILGAGMGFALLALEEMEADL